MRILLVILLCLITVKVFAVRDENITDEEVLQIESAVSSFTKGQINYIGIVNGYCSCMDGPDCKATVDLTVKSPLETKLYELSQIKGTWQVGPRLKIGLEYKKLKKLVEDARESNNEEALASLYKERELLIERVRELKKSCNQ